MRAIILAAGDGGRMAGGVAGGVAKSLLWTPNGRTVLQEIVLSFQTLMDEGSWGGELDLVVVGGKFMASLEREALMFSDQPRIASCCCINNPAWAETDNLFSLSLAQREIEPPAIILNGDTMVAPYLLRELLKAAEEKGLARLVKATGEHAGVIAVGTEEGATRLRSEIAALLAHGLLCEEKMGSRAPEEWLQQQHLFKSGEIGQVAELVAPGEQILELDTPEDCVEMAKRGPFLWSRSE